MCQFLLTVLLILLYCIALLYCCPAEPFCQVVRTLSKYYSYDSIMLYCKYITFEYGTLNYNTTDSTVVVV